MNSGGSELQRYLLLCKAFMNAHRVSFEEALLEVPEQLRDDVAARWETEHAQTIRPVVVLAAGDEETDWFREWDPSQGYYWQRQREYLLYDQGWSKANVDSLDDASDSILRRLGDPREVGPSRFNVRGLVMGRVQSGKTANYCAVTAKSADLGYRLVIVLSGIHNSLRQQTQARVNRSLGVDPSGVETPDAERQWMALTTTEIDGDFRPGTLDARSLLAGNPRAVLVIKKNNAVLRRLIMWLRSYRNRLEIPAIIIDDEADQASINTGGNRPPNEDLADLAVDDIEDPDTELDPSAINRSIRDLLGLFDRVSYVAYTATPFANVLISHTAVDREVMEDLYPRDFIVALPTPGGYVGAEVLFGREELPDDEGPVDGLDVIELVPDHEAEELTPSQREVDDWVANLPPSLRAAVRDFVLATAGYRERTQSEGPTTMLIHTHHRCPVQNSLSQAVITYAAELRQEWRYGGEETRSAWREMWDSRFSPVTASLDSSKERAFDAITPHIDQILREPLLIRVLNSESEDSLDYRCPDYNVVVIGGNRLSRGLTLEGLLVSYYVRRTMCFDTLMQMGRWFGFRAEYVDLTRIWTTEELSQWFRDISLAEEELAREMRRYEKERIKPTELGPKIRAHPIMMVTSRPKMRNARLVEQNYAGRLISITSYSLDSRSRLEGNLEATSKFIEGLGEPLPETGSASQPVWKSVSWKDVCKFFSEYRTDPSGTYEVQAIRQYVEKMAAAGELTDWWVSVRGLEQADESLGIEPRLSVSGSPMPCISRTRVKSAPRQIKALITPAGLKKPRDIGDDVVGLTDDQKDRARARAAQDGQLGYELRKERNCRQGLLLIYPISKYSTPSGSSTTRVPLFEDPERDGVTVIGLAFVFPESDNPAATIEYIGGTVQGDE